LGREKIKRGDKEGKKRKKKRSEGKKRSELKD